MKFWKSAEFYFHSKKKREGSIRDQFLTWVTETETAFVYKLIAETWVRCSVNSV